MSANPQADLQQVKSKFENFRAARTGKERLPENLWAAAVALLDHYPFKTVWRELRIKPDYLRKRAESAKGKLPTQSVQKKPNFLALTGHELTAIRNASETAALSLTQVAACRIAIERCDGSRLTLNLPTDWSRIEQLCADFLRA